MEKAPLLRSHTATRALAAVGAGALLLGASAVLLDLFGPKLPYSMTSDPAHPLDSDEFLEFLSTVTDGTVHRCRITRLKNGNEFYPAELEAIRGARHSVNLEYYTFDQGRVSAEVLDALIERARAGVEVRLTVDAIGSFHTHASWFDELKKAGGHMVWYHPLRPQIWQKLNNRTHRKLLIVDSATGFIGGAGIADRWLYSTNGTPAWRDTVFKVEGEIVAGLISTFSENWLEASGEILSGARQFTFHPAPDGAKGFVVISTPHGGGTQARILFQALIKSARKTLRITTPYFLPDRSARDALADASRRGVQVQILTAGPYIDHPMVRRLSRDGSTRLLKAGAEIFEYQPSMIHAKLMTVDGQWNVVGSTNFDHRSFGLNDEVNLAVLNPHLASVIEGDFFEDLKQSRPLTLEMLKRRSLLSREEGVVDYVVEEES